jgi:hypothetical protein
MFSAELTIDSSGAAALVLARRQARRAGGDLLLAAPREQVLRCLNASGLIDVFPVLASAEQAAAGRAGRSPRAATAMSYAAVQQLPQPQPCRRLLRPLA